MYEPRANRKGKADFSLHMKLAESVRIKPDHAVELVLYALLLANVRLHEEEGVEEDGGDKCGEHGPHLQGRPHQLG